MIKTHKIKMYPNATMRQVLTQLFDYRRYCYNQALEVWNGMYDESVVMADKALRPSERKVRDELVNNKQDWQYAHSARILQLAVNDLAKGWQNYFDPNMPNHARPRFKSKKRSKRSFKTDRAKVVAGKLRLDKPRGVTAWYDIRLAEQPRWNGEIKLASVVEEADGYYVSLAIEVETAPEPKAGDCLTAVDANIAHFDYKNQDGYQSTATMTNRLLGLYQRITYYQRSLAHKRTANPNHFRSNNYCSVRTKLKQSYQKVSRIQADIVHKLTAELVRDNDIIAIENLDNVHMRMNKHLAKNLHRSLFGQFKQMMLYKCAWYGVRLVMVDRLYPSTQRCSQCGYVKAGDEKVGLDGNRKHHTRHDEYVCYQCGAEMRRDENAVENLIQYAQIN